MPQNNAAMRSDIKKWDTSVPKCTRNSSRDRTSVRMSVCYWVDMLNIATRISLEVHRIAVSNISKYVMHKVSNFWTRTRMTRTPTRLAET
jgi:hypothetical protein